MRVDAINAAFDRIPRDVVRVGARELPAFRSIGIIGFHVALPVAMATAVRAGLPIADAFALSATAVVSFFAWALLRRAVTGSETIVLLEHVVVAGAAVAAYLWAARAPMRSGADVLAVGLCAFLAIGRLSCLVAGCCHGHPATVGAVYGPGVVPRRLVGVRLFPVPFVESAALATIGVVGFAFAGGRPGVAAVWCACAYATVRFGTESLRGDHRPAVLGLPVVRIAAAALLGAGLVASEAWFVDDEPSLDRRRLVLAGVLGVTAIAGVVLTLRRRDSLATPAHANEVWTVVESLTRRAPVSGDPVVEVTTRGVTVAASWTSGGLHVSLSHPSLAADGLPGLLGLEVAARTASALHVVVPLARLGMVAVAPSAPAAPAAVAVDDPPLRTAVGERQAVFVAPDRYFGSSANG